MKNRSRNCYLQSIDDVLVIERPLSSIRCIANHRTFSLKVIVVMVSSTSSSNQAFQTGIAKEHVETWVQVHRNSDSPIFGQDVQTPDAFLDVASLVENCECDLGKDAERVLEKTSEGWLTCLHDSLFEVGRVEESDDDLHYSGADVLFKLFVLGVLRTYLKETIIICRTFSSTLNDRGKREKFLEFNQHFWLLINWRIVVSLQIKEYWAIMKKSDFDLILHLRVWPSHARHV